MRIHSRTIRKYALYSWGGSGALDDKIKEIKDFAYILKYGRSKRCKIIRLFIGIFSLKITIRLLDFLRNRKNGRKFQ